MACDDSSYTFNPLQVHSKLYVQVSYLPLNTNYILCWKGQSHEKVCEIMTSGDNCGLNLGSLTVFKNLKLLFQKLSFFKNVIRNQFL
jgi:hypothetical protein